MMDAINIAILLGLLLIALAITIIKLELIFRSILNASKEEKRILEPGEERSQRVELELHLH